LLSLLWIDLFVVVNVSAFLNVDDLRSHGGSAIASSLRQQGDRMSLFENRPKCSPNPFFVKNGA
jgi:hypothetical protein